MNNDSILEWAAEVQTLLQLLETPQKELLGLIKRKVTKIVEAC